MHDGITIDGKHSYSDFGLLISDRQIKNPKKKSIRGTIPYMNGFYDFSAITGKPCWEEREIEYTFDILEDSIEDMDALRDQINEWLLNIQDTEIHDDTMPLYHFKGSYYDSSISEDAEFVELKVTFICHPFKIYNTDSSVNLTSGQTTITNEGQEATLKAVATNSMTIELNSLTQTVGTTLTELELKLQHGENIFTVNGTGSITLAWRKEVF